ncbi:magnesium chelatase subunit D [Dethiosulfatibacter aminovorans DSM 17477]|uniref:Magnesium chelatase subunit D n=1 Tax=Dethiosulfatibacter aminovorans DSM 17477 TaxID=1121476 RepID=A0A1M6LXE6_9FIRM|nr:VWA domain-containing protein [Dethiosulfatibacter aminovorans]SHJ75841.1 magnesium chelatase subunit D [Dethiosulfatibacter aminovorans DSM 17477]
MFDEKIIFPFTAVIGQDDMKKVLIWNMVNPAIGGVLISGEKGTAKSTLVRGLCNVMPDIDLVELPLNVTEDSLSGNIDFEHAVKHGEKRFEGGILQKAHNNVLYIDEVNLLSDHIVKALLESSASGVNIVEREGISFQHEARFILVGSMNPEEGALRPQFLDRFGLYVEVKGESDVRKRTEIVRRRIRYERNPARYLEEWRSHNVKLMQKIKRAKEDLDKVSVTHNAMQLAASIAKEANCAGHRGELVIIEAAKAIAALDSRIVLNIDDIKEAAKFALPHRVRENDETNEPEPQDMPDDSENQENEDMDNDQQDNDQNDFEREEPDQQEEQSDHEPDSSQNTQDGSSDEDTPPEMEMPGEDSENVDDPGEVFAVSKWLSENKRSIVEKGSGKRSLVKTSSKQGRYVRYRCPVKGKINDIAIDATLRASAPYQLKRDRKGMAVAIDKSDIRVKVREKRTGNTIIFVVDASGSMGANKRMKAVKGAIMSLLNDAYQKRDKVGMVAFKKSSSDLLLGITRSVELAEKKLASLPTGGRTPLASGLDMAYEIVKAEKAKDKDMLPVIVLVTDGRATYGSGKMDAFDEALISASRIGAEGIKSVVIDTDNNFIKLNLADKISSAMNADCFKIEDIRTQDIVAAVKLSV